MHSLPDPLAENRLNCVQILPHPVSYSSVDKLEGISRLSTCLAKRTLLHFLHLSALINYPNSTATQGCDSHSGRDSGPCLNQASCMQLLDRSQRWGVACKSATAHRNYGALKRARAC